MTKVGRPSLWRLLLPVFLGVSVIACDQAIVVGRGQEVPMLPVREIRLRKQGTYNQGSSVSALALVDLDKDGKQDLVTTHPSTGELRLRRGFAGGTFGDEETLALSASPVGLALGDLNGDGLQDLVLSDPMQGQMLVLLCRAGGRLDVTARFSLPERPTYPALGDLDGDRRLDLVVAGESLHVLRGIPSGMEGGGAFTPVRTLALPVPARSLALAAVGASMRPDLIVGLASGVVQIYVPNFVGINLEFRQATPIQSYLDLSFVLPVIWNGDRQRDLFLGASSGNVVGAVYALGPEIFVTEKSSDRYTVGEAPASLVQADLNRDGIEDVVTGNRVGGSVSVLLGPSRPGLLPLTFAAELAPSALAASDLDGDRLPELVLASGNQVTILKNESR